MRRRFAWIDRMSAKHAASTASSLRSGQADQIGELELQIACYEGRDEVIVLAPDADSHSKAARHDSRW